MELVHKGQHHRHLFVAQLHVVAKVAKQVRARDVGFVEEKTLVAAMRPQPAERDPMFEDLGVHFGKRAMTSVSVIIIFAVSVPRIIRMLRSQSRD